MKFKRYYGIEVINCKYCRKKYVYLLGKEKAFLKRFLTIKKIILVKLFSLINNSKIKNSSILNIKIDTSFLIKSKLLLINFQKQNQNKDQFLYFIKQIAIRINNLQLLSNKNQEEKPKQLLILKKFYKKHLTVKD